MTTHAPLRSQWTKAVSVYHVRGLGDGDCPTSLTKDTRLLAVACKPSFGADLGQPPAELSQTPRTFVKGAQ